MLLPGEGRKAWQVLAALGPDAVTAAAWAAGRALIDQHYELSVAQGLIESNQAPSGDGADALLDETVTLVRRAPTEGGTWDEFFEQDGTDLPRQEPPEAPRR